jgi:hypothetical protein
MRELRRCGCGAAARGRMHIAHSACCQVVGERVARSQALETRAAAQIVTGSRDAPSTSGRISSGMSSRDACQSLLLLLLLPGRAAACAPASKRGRLVDAAAAAAGTISPSVALAQGTASARPARAHHDHRPLQELVELPRFAEIHGHDSTYSICRCRWQNLGG